METIYDPHQEQKQPAQFAGFWWRFLSHIIDQIIISFVSWIFILPIFAVFGISMYSLREAGMNPEDATFLVAPFVLGITTISLVATAANWLYYALMESSKFQGTVGKILLNIKVTDVDFQRVSFARATGRYFGKILSGMILMIGYIMAGLTENKQALHDILAGCYVVKE